MVFLSIHHSIVTRCCLAAYDIGCAFALLKISIACRHEIGRYRPSGQIACAQLPRLFSSGAYVPLIVTPYISYRPWRAMALDVKKMIVLCYQGLLI